MRMLQEPPANVIVLEDGLEWVYAGPCAGVGGCGDSLPHHGFHFASDAEWNQSWATINELTTAFAGKCAAPWFNIVHNHCDFGDAAAGFIWHSPLAPDANHRDNPLAETFMVRNAAVPEPASLVLIGAALAGLGLARRRKA
jgi:hypothetical protein